jgi:hypothetical protein
MAGDLRRIYLGSLGVCGAAAVASLFAVRSLAAVALSSPLLAPAVPTQGVEPFVFVWSSVAYVLLAAALYNVLVMFVLSRPEPVLRAVATAIALDGGIGIVLTRVTTEYQLAVVGLLAATVYLLVATTRAVLRLLPEIDYLRYRIV